MSTWFLFLLICQRPAQQDTLRAAVELDNKGAELFQLSDYNEAARRQQRALLIWEELSRCTQVDLAAPHFNLARTYLAQGKLSAADRESRAARRLANQSTSPADRSRIAVLIAQIHFHSRDYAKAEQELTAALSGLEGAERATALNDLGMVRAALGDLVEARQLIESSLAVRQQNGTARADDFGRMLGNLALVCFRQGDLSTAVSLYEHAIKALEASPAVNQTELGMALAEYSQVLLKSGRKSEATHFEKRAKSILSSAGRLSFQTIDIRGLR